MTTDLRARSKGGEMESASVTPVPMEVAPEHYWWRWVTGLIALGIVLWVALLFARGNIEWAAAKDYLFDPRVMQGLRMTLVYSALAMLLGVLGGLLLAIMKLSANPVLRQISNFYIWVFRGTPVLVQLLLWFNIALILPKLSVTIPLTGWSWAGDTNVYVTPFVAALLGLGLHQAAYMAEIVRAGIISVNKGQTEAAQALGLTPILTLRHVVLPQAMRIIIPPTGNEFIGLLKTTSLVVVISGNELMTVVQNIYAENFLTVELLFVASFWYLVLTSISSVALSFLEDSFGQQDRVRRSLGRKIVQDLRLTRSHIGGGES